MFSSIYSATSGMEADLFKMDVIANNMANMDTTGYKRGILTTKSFSDRLAERISNLPDPEGVYVDDVVTDFSKGDPTYTGGSFDMCLNSEGFFTIQTPNGIEYTRNGAFLLDNDGFLITKQGYRVMGQSGAINVGPYSKVEIKEDGEIFGDGIPLDKLYIADFPKPYQMLRRQDTSFIPDANAQSFVVENPSISQHYLEESNVSSIGIMNEMISMINVFRHYEACQKVVTMQDQTLGRTVNDMAKV